MTSKEDEPVRTPKQKFARETLINYGQILAYSAAYGVSPHRIKLAKLQEISEMKPEYQKTSE
jgi:hypothetical protein